MHVPGGRQGTDPREEHRRFHLHVQPQGQVPVIPFNVAWASGVFEVQDSFQGLKRWKEKKKKGHLLLPEPTAIRPRGRPPSGEEGETMGTGQLHQGGHWHLTLVPSFLQRRPAANNTHDSQPANTNGEKLEDDSVMGSSISERQVHLSQRHLNTQIRLGGWVGASMRELEHGSWANSEQG